MMEKLKKVKGSGKNSKKSFIAVDVWRSQFGPISVRAIYEIFARTFSIEPSQMKDYKLPQCIDALRKLEDPTYECPQDKSN
jgi:hypothetical protein